MHRPHGLQLQPSQDSMTDRATTPWRATTATETACSTAMATASATDSATENSTSVACVKDPEPSTPADAKTSPQETATAMETNSTPLGCVEENASKTSTAMASVILSTLKDAPTSLPSTTTLRPQQRRVLPIPQDRITHAEYFFGEQTQGREAPHRSTSTTDNGTKPLSAYSAPSNQEASKGSPPST